MSAEETDDYSIWRNLPPDIIPHLLSRLPLKSLCRFKCVSHSWKSLISSSQTHINPTDTNNPSKAILISSSQAFFSVDFADVNPTAKKLDFSLLEHSPNRVKVLGSCNCLLLVSFSSREGNSKFLWNLFTRECKELPKSPVNARALVYGVGYDFSTDDYKVVMVASYPDTSYVAVYSLKTDAWKEIPNCDFAVGASPGVYLNGHLHWIWRSGRLNGSRCIVAFDFSDEIFREIQLPVSFDSYKIWYHQVAVVGGCFCLLVHPNSDRIEVWMMKEYGVRESWTRLIMIDDSGMSHVKLLSLLSDEDFLLYFDRGNREDDKLVVYNMKKETQMDMVVRDIPTKFTVLATYAETLVSPHHKGRTGRQCEASSREPAWHSPFEGTSGA